MDWALVAICCLPFVGAAYLYSRKRAPRIDPRVKAPVNGEMIAAFIQILGGVAIIALGLAWLGLAFHWW